MAALKSRAPFQVLIMCEESRIGREAIETNYALKQIMEAGARVFLCLDNRERTLNTALDAVMLSLTNFAMSLRLASALRAGAAAATDAGRKRTC